jgi:hypothetical protein
MICKICSTPSEPKFEKLVLKKYLVKYHQCVLCKFIQTDNPFWIKEAYDNAITSLDIGLVFRNILFQPLLQAVISRYYDRRKKFIDFGGGYGLFVRMMRDQGFDFYRQDFFCENLFAQHFDIEDIDQKSNFELLSAFEVFEHLVDPIREIENMLTMSKSIFFSTELSPEKNVESWHYLVPEVGQHISLYNYETLKYIGEKFNLNLYSNKRNLHLLTPIKINPWIFEKLTKTKVSFIHNILFSESQSLLASDFSMVKKKLYA